MAEREALQKRYAYAEMSNKVQRADRRSRRDGDGGGGGGGAGGPTGEVESLWNVLPPETLGRMGDRVGATADDGGAEGKKSERPAEVAEMMERAAKRRKKKEANDYIGGAAGAAAGGGGPSSKRRDNILLEAGTSILDDSVGVSAYRPTNPASRSAYETLLNILSSKQYLGNQPSSILRGALDEVLETLKDANYRDPERKEVISKLLTGRGSNLPDAVFAQMVQLGKAMDDYEDYKNRASGQNNNEDENGNNGVDDEMGVAVVFDDSEEEEEGNRGVDEDERSDVEEDVVVDVGDSSSDEGGGNREANEGGKNDDESGDEELIVQGSTARTKSGGGKGGVRILSVHEIDAHYLQRRLAATLDDADECAKVADQVLSVLDIRGGTSIRECENQLLVLLGFERFDLIKTLLANRARIWGCVSIKRAVDESTRDSVEKALMEDESGEGGKALNELRSRSAAEDWKGERMKSVKDTLRKQRGDGFDNDSEAVGGESKMSKALDSVKVGSRGDNDGDESLSDVKRSAHELDFDSLAFREGSHTMTNKKCELPDQSWRAMKPGYEEVHVPAVRSVAPPGEKLVPIADLPEWTRDAFKGMKMLNRVQSKMADVALRSSENVLLCAPTGAGKTNVAMLSILNILAQYRKESADDMMNEDESGKASKHEGTLNLSAFKIVYVAPMKALVQEVVKNFSKRLAPYGIQVRELSGDSSLTRQQISETQMIVTTPEKWDIVTRQGEGRAYTQLVRLVIIDEIHLLHDDRGPVLESIVARVIRQVETTAEPIRLVGLSATLPNYADVATFLRVDPKKGMFFFDHSYRPVPLQMQYIGITERNAFRRFQLQNEICYEKATMQRRNGNQMLIFVHSRAETGKTAKALRDLAMENDQLSLFVKEGSSTQEILREELGSVKNADLKDVLSYGFAIHHAGMARADRELVEDLFADGHIGVLCCTATLAWGVNLPAHAVIIKGTQIYDPSKGRWAELSPLDVLQMLGRAGRPQYDNEGEGIIMTAHSELQYYLSLTNLQLPVESQMIKTLPDNLNAEIVLGTVQTVSEAVEWLSYTFLYVRMLKNPNLYGISDTAAKEDPTLKHRRMDLAHTAACILERSHLIRYDRRSGALQSTPLGRIASQYYISHSSMAMYSRHLRPNMADIDLLRLFSMSGEFTHITVREEEKMELSKLATRVPIPVKESPNEPSAKINILLQAYISRLKLDGFALVSDMAFIQQSAARIMRALFEISLRRGWASLSKLTLAFSNMVAYRIWRSQSPLRQFKNVPEIVARKLERKSDIEWARYADLNPSDLGELVGVPKMGRTLHKLVHQFPKLELSAHIQPITRSTLRVELNLVPDFEFDINVHGYVQLFHIIVEDVNGESILHHEMFLLKNTGAEDEHTVIFTVNILDPLPPSYFIRVISDRWLHSEAVLPISFNKMILPAKFYPPTELLDLQPLPISVLGETALVKLYKFKEFNPIQTQTFHHLFKTDKNCLLCAPSGSGKSACAEFAIMRMLVNDPQGKCVYVAPKEETALHTYQDWSTRFGSILRSGQVVQLTGEVAPDLKLIGEAKIIICTAKQWDAISRRWRQRRAVQAVTLFIVDDLHFLGGNVGPTMEVIISRMRFISTQKQQKQESQLRMIGLSASLANAREVGEWMGVSSKGLFNFSPKVRPVPLEIYFHAFDQSNFASRLMAMGKPAYNAVMRHSDSKPSIIFVPSRRQAQLTAIDLMTYRQSIEGETFLSKDADSDRIAEVASKLREPALQQVTTSGISFLHDGMVEDDWEAILGLYSDGAINILVCPVDICWKVKIVAHLVVIMGTETFDGRERRYVDYPIADLLHMMGMASRQGVDSSGKCVIMCHTPKKEHLKKLLYDPLPIESHIDHYLHDHFNSEIVTKTISCMQDAVDYITWTLLYRRLSKNPNYYNLQGTSNVHLSEHISDMVETVLGDLEASKCCQLTDDGDVSPLNLGMIAAYYYVQYETIELIAASLTAKTKVRGILEILSHASEFSNLPIRQGEEKALKILARSLPQNLPESAQFQDPRTKALVLLHCHFSRKALSTDLHTDQKRVICDSINLIPAIVDVISSNGWLKPALAAMELSQMVVQGLWNKDNILMQIPHFTKEIVQRCEAYEGEEPIESVFDILTLEDDVRNDLLRLPEEKMADVAVFCNNYPNIEVAFDVQDADDITASDPVQIVVTLEREVDEDDEDEIDESEMGKVAASLFPKEKREGWWIVIGDTKTNSLLSLKRVNLQRKQKAVLEFMAPDEPGDYNLTLFCMSDSYLGCDQEYSVPISVAVGDSDDDESSSGGESN
jgi:pre-mRNA-splicing helicase BRR2